MSSSTNTTNSSLPPQDGNGDECRPTTTDVVIPGEDVVVDHWVVSSGSAVRARETIAYVRKRSSEGSNTSDIVAPTVAAPKHKRPTRRKKKGAKTEVQGNPTTAVSSSSSSSSAPATTKSTAMSLKELLAAKKNRKEEPSATATAMQTESTSEMEIEPPKSSSTSTSTSTVVSSKAKQTMPIHAPASGILRIVSSKEQQSPQRRLVIGVIEECLHPTVLDGMCVVCGTPIASMKDSEKYRATKNTGNAQKTSKVTVSGGVTMTVSQRESESMALLDSGRLFRQKRLSLVLDLDHTLVHATADARARQYLDPGHPLAVEPGEVRTISLPMFEGVDNGKKTTVDPRHKYMRSQHYVKLRPFVKEFLDGVRTMYEVSVYTAGTRQYAEEIAMVLCRKLAGATIDSDELEEMRHKVKMAEEEYARNLKDDKKRTIDEMPTDTAGMEEEKANDQPPRKKKKVSFQVSEAVDDKGGGYKNDRITKEQLAEMQAKLRSAEALETKAKSLRQNVFGSRIISRTDVGDLGRDVKSLKRVFPCGGTMAAVVDDREDVWANAKDNSKGTIKGEPPDNLLLVRPYHWQPFVGFADVNNAAGADLSGSGPTNTDRQLLWTKEILEKLHRRFYQQSAEGNRKTVPETLKQMRREVLMGSNIVLSGLVPLHKQSISGAVARPHFVRYAQNLGAKIQDKVDYSVTHVVAAKDGTDKALSAKKIPGCMLVKSAWLMECFWSMSRRNATPFLMHMVKPGVARSNVQPMPNVLRESHIENSSEGSANDSDDDDFAAEFESELMDMS